mmetsp:Transcript_43965/g.115500  ORF Transcript_43965/g.115500 Transcript_43965/m.115500 type:complete len:206 (+) Transcript_43965:87-704(+)|eukprot:CAMPEP_0115862818 /NCGR_PEP_ID=MMETSP0287-20121206/18375_1 /TAXON_ID=412157 /ORGANISM="Chrysochromulina rotalis, Strain UIO044" /LENGTH=205 /DNA_ID=CAMNT_0003317257 /DNA_START=66 /DNA_END=683 /DNA_ORIENTATION=-
MPQRERVACLRHLGGPFFNTDGTLRDDCPRPPGYTQRKIVEPRKLVLAYKRPVSLWEEMDEHGAPIAVSYITSTATSFPSPRFNVQPQAPTRHGSTPRVPQSGVGEALGCGPLPTVASPRRPIVHSPRSYSSWLESQPTASAAAPSAASPRNSGYKSMRVDLEAQLKAERQLHSAKQADLLTSLRWMPVHPDAHHDPLGMPIRRY